MDCCEGNTFISIKDIYMCESGNKKHAEFVARLRVRKNRRNICSGTKTISQSVNTLL